MRNLSFPLQKRLQIILCTIGKPHILLFDEPTKGLDIENKKIVMKYINLFKHLNRSMAITTSSINEAELFGNKIGILSKGELLKVCMINEIKSFFGVGLK